MTDTYPKDSAIIKLRTFWKDILTRSVPKSVVAVGPIVSSCRHPGKL